MSTNRRDDLNSVTFTGEVVGDPDYRKTRNDKALLKFRTMIRGRSTTFIRCVAWEDVAQTKIERGDRISVSGRLSYSEWETKDGQKRSEVEVTVHELQVLEQADDVARGLSGLSHAGEAAQRFLTAIKGGKDDPGQQAIQF